MRFARLMLCCIALSAVTNVHVAADETENENVPIGEGTMVIIGASYARAWPIESVGGRAVVNKGVNGNQSFEMLARFREDVLSTAPGSVIIWGFINDIFRSDLANVDGAIDRVKRSFAEMCDLAADEDVTVILATEVTIREPRGITNALASFVGRLLGKTSYQTQVNRHVIETNAWLRDFAARRGLTLLEFEQVLAGPDGQRRSEYAADDGSHLSDAAYDALSTYTVAALATDPTDRERAESSP